MRVLVTGASGLLGRAVVRVFSPVHEVLGLAFSRAGPALRKCDITNAAELAEIFESFKPQVVIHCAAERRPDVVAGDANATKALNVHASHAIAAAAHLVCRFVFLLLADPLQHGAVLVYISTDYVFDGTAPPYHPSSVPNPLNDYGVTKLEGERAVLAACPSALVLRVPSLFFRIGVQIFIPRSVLYGPVEHIDESAVLTVFKAVLSPKPSVHSDYEKRYPTLVDDVAEVLLQMCQHRHEHPAFAGIYHWSGNEELTKYEMAVTMGEVAGLPTAHLSPSKESAPGVQRPYNAHLACDALEVLGIGKRTPFRTALASILPSLM